MKIPTGKRVTVEYEPLFKRDCDKGASGYLTSGSFGKLKDAKRYMDDRDDLVEYKIVRIIKTYEYETIKEWKK